MSLSRRSPSTRAGRGAPSIVAAAMLWGTTGTAARFAPAGVPAAVVGTAGLLIGGLLLAAAGGIRPWFAGWRTRLLVAAGTVAVAGCQLSFYPAVHHAGVAPATVVAIAGAPVFAGLAGLFLDPKHPRRRWLLGTAACLAGTAVLVFGGGGHAVADPVGLGLAALSGACYAAYSVLAALLVRLGHASRSVLGAMFGGAALLVLPLQLAAGPAWLATVRGGAVVAWLSVVCVFTAYVLFGHGLRTVSAATATTLSLAEPAVATVLGVVVAGERLSAVGWAGLAVLGAGLAVVALPRRRHMPTLR